MIISVIERYRFLLAADITTTIGELNPNLRFTSFAFRIAKFSYKSSRISSFSPSFR